MVCSCAMSFNCIWLQTLFCSCVNETTLAPSCDHGRSLRRLGRERFGKFTRSKEQWKYNKSHKSRLWRISRISKRKKINEESLISPKEKLPSVMRKFYAEGRKRNVELYTSFTSRDMLHSPEEEHICNEPSIEHSNTKQRVKNFYNCTFKF